ncbi:hypothetical protein HNP02_002743 [Mycobacterium sp. AZCC_0083]|nr:hypothetical protein [Mycobacterium sp. AZCC_0083]
MTPSADETLRDDHAELLRRRALTEDAARPDAVERRHGTNGRTARENVADLVDPDSFVEYGRFAIAAQRFRRDVDDLIARTPADGLVAGTARIDGNPCAVLAYDYTVLAGTQGALGHRKKDRLFDVIERMRLPTVFFAEGGGGRPGDTDYPVVSSLDVRAFKLWAALSGLVPRIAVVNGRCFAGNAVIAGCADLIVATENASIGMGGPAMIAGGGLGDVHPDEVGPISVQHDGHGRGDHRRRLGQGRPLPAAVRCVRASRRLADRLPWLHGRPRRGGRSAGTPWLAHAGRGGFASRAPRRGDPASRVWAWGTGDVRRRAARTIADRGVAGCSPRSDGAGGCRAAWPSQGA